MSIILSTSNGDTNSLSASAEAQKFLYDNRKVLGIDNPDWISYLQVYDGIDLTTSNWSEADWTTYSEAVTKKLQEYLGLEQTGQFCYPDYLQMFYNKNKPTTQVTGDVSSPVTIQQTRTKGSWGPFPQVIQCVVMNNVTGSYVSFNMPPESLSESLSNSYDDNSIRGRSSPIRGYSNSGPRSISFTLSLFQDYCPSGLKQTEDFLRALCYPSYSGSVVPPSATFILGNTITLIGTVDSVSLDHKPPIKDGYYSLVDASISMTEVEAQTTDAKAVEGGGL